MDRRAGGRKASKNYPCDKIAATGRRFSCLARISARAVVAACSIARGAEEPAPAPADAPTPAMDAIVVSSERLPVETLIDRKVYSVTSDVLSTFGTLSDILNVIPSVDVDPDGVLSLRGDSNVLILIDGKPSTQFSGASAGENLQSIPAKDIERIEILTTPPAQFKADGAAGVINIITRKRRPAGEAGTLQASWGIGGRYILGADGSHRSGRLTMAATAGYRQDYRQRLVQSEVMAPDPSTGLPSESRSLINERIRREVPTVGLSAEFAFSDAQSITAAVKWADRGGLRTYTEQNDSGTKQVPTGSARRLSSGHDPENDYDEKIGFLQKLGRPGETLDLSLHRSTSSQHEHYDYTNESLLPPAPAFFDNLTFQEEHATTELGADYALPFSKTRSIKLGYAFEQDDFSLANVGATVDPSTGAQRIEPALTNDFKFRQRIDALYASYQATTGAWTWLAGLRAELTHTDARQPRSYFEIYPSIHVDRVLSEGSTLTFGASRRVVRPDPASLNPYVDHEYTPNLAAGNPELKPQFTQSYEAGYGFEGHRSSYALTGYYRLNRDGVTDITEYLGNGFSLTTKTNLPRNDSEGLEFTSNGRIAAQLSYSVSGNLFRSQIDARALGIAGLQSTTGLNAKLKFNYRPTQVDSAQVSFTRTDKRLTPQGFIDPINIVNLGYRRELRPELTALATVSDLFNGQRYKRLLATPNLSEEYQRNVSGRIFYVGFVYAFGISRKEKQPNFEYDQTG